MTSHIGMTTLVNINVKGVYKSNIKTIFKALSKF